MSVQHPSVEVTCDRCGHTESIEGDSTTSGHWMYPTPDEIGWGWGEEGDLCPECSAGGNKEEK